MNQREAPTGADSSDIRAPKGQTAATAGHPWRRRIDRQQHNRQISAAAEEKINQQRQCNGSRCVPALGRQTGAAQDTPSKYDQGT